MDPIAIVGLVDASIGLALKCAGAVKKINDIASKYKNSKYTLMSITQYLDTMQYAWERIGSWTESYTANANADDDGFVVRMARILETGTLVMDALEEDLVPFSRDGIDYKQRAKLIWNENTFLGHQHRIRDQATSMSLLLQAIQLPTPNERGWLIRKSEQQFRISDESAYSIVPSQMSSRLSISTCQTDGHGSIIGKEEMKYRRLSFEDDLFTARVYKRNYRTPLPLRLWKKRPQRTPGTTALVDISQHAKRELFHDNGPGSATDQTQQLNPRGSIEEQYVPSRPTEQHNSPFPRHLGHLNQPLKWKLARHLSTNSWTAAETNLGDPTDSETSDPRSTLSFGIRFNQPMYSLTAGLSRKFFFACEQGDCSTVQDILRVGHDVHSQQACRDGIFFGAIHVAVMCGQIGVARILLENGASIEDTTSSISPQPYHQTTIDYRPTSKSFGPLHLGAFSGNITMIRFLLANGAHVNAENQYGEQPIHLAAARGWIKALRLLISAGAGVNCSDIDNHQPLHFAAGSSKGPAVIALLVHAGADIEACIATRPYARALHIACRLNLRENVLALLALGAATTNPSLFYTPPLHTAIEHGSLAALEALLEYGVDPNWNGSSGTTALHLAIDMASNKLAEEDLLQLLLRYRVSVDVQDKNGDTALHKIARQSCGRPSDTGVQSAKILLENGADLAAHNNMGHTPLYLAIEGHGHGMSSLLIQSGAKRLGKTVLSSDADSTTVGIPRTSLDQESRSLGQIGIAVTTGDGDTATSPGDHVGIATTT